MRLDRFVFSLLACSTTGLLLSYGLYSSGHGLGWDTALLGLLLRRGTGMLEFEGLIIVTCREVSFGILVGVANG